MNFHGKLMGKSRSMGRTIVIGDIHGCYDELVALLNELSLAPEDRVVAVGDLVVKGPKNRQVLDLFRADSRFSSVIGNHDLALVRYWSGESPKLKNSQRLAAEELSIETDTYFGYLKSLPSLIDLGKYVVVHAGVRPGVPLEQQSIDDLTALRTLGPDRTDRAGIPWFEVYEGEKIVLFGHWPGPEPKRGRAAIGIDTGCVYGYHLTAFIIESEQFVRVPAKRAYAEPATASKPLS